MRPISQLLLNFLINACWQIALIAAASSVCDWLLRSTAYRFRHWLWVSALALSLGLPLLSAGPLFARRAPSGGPIPAALKSVPVAPGAAEPALPARGRTFANVLEPIRLGRKLAVALMALYLAFFFYRSLRLCQAWSRTRRLARSAQPLASPSGLETIIERCERAVGVRAPIFYSDSEPVPLTLGVRQPLVILPRPLLLAADVDLLTAALGHELVHVRRHDYLLNLIYELIFLPLAFHPGAAFLRRRIHQTRELSCDELVAEKLLGARVYARSLVQLAGAAPPARALASVTTVGIADADILEVRVMSLLKSKPIVRRKNLLLVASSLVLVLPCVAAASFAFHCDLGPGEMLTSAAEPIQQEKESQEKGETEVKARERRQRQDKEDRELKQRLEQETNPAARTELKELLERQSEERAKADRAGNVADATEIKRYEILTTRAQEEKELVELAARDAEIQGEIAGNRLERQEEEELMLKRHRELTRLAQIPMDQAIQIAVSQHPGKVLECSLIGEHWEGEGQSARPGRVLYNVVIVPAEGTAPVTLSGRDGQTYIGNLTSVHVLVNASDGSIFRTTTNEQRRQP